MNKQLKFYSADNNFGANKNLKNSRVQNFEYELEITEIIPLF